MQQVQSEELQSGTRLLLSATHHAVLEVKEGGHYPSGLQRERSPRNTIWMTIGTNSLCDFGLLNLTESTVLVCNGRPLRCRGKHSIFHSIFQMSLHIHDRFSEICFEFPSQIQVSFSLPGLDREMGGFPIGWQEHLLIG